MVPVVEARVDREKLAEVLAEASESEAVEWKARGDLNDREVLVDLAAEVTAMQLRPDGGYVVLGWPTTAGSWDSVTRRSGCSTPP